MKHQSIQVLERAVDILEHLGNREHEASVTEISVALGLDKTTAYRILACLSARQLVTKDPQTRRYTLGIKAFELGTAVARRWDVRRVSAPLLQALRDETEETVGLYIRSGKYRVCVDQYESRKEVRRTLPLGTVRPMYPGASGKVFLAYMPRSEAEGILAETVPVALVRGRSKSIPEVLTDLDEIVRRGYGLGIEELIPNGVTLSVPVFDFSGGVRAVIAIATTTFGWTTEREAYLAEVSKRTASAISTALGYQDVPSQIAS